MLSAVMVVVIVRTGGDYSEEDADKKTIVDEKVQEL